MFKQRFICNSIPEGQFQAIENLVVGKIYTLKNKIIFDWYTILEFFEVPGEYGSTYFTEISVNDNLISHIYDGIIYEEIEV